MERWNSVYQYFYTSVRICGGSFVIAADLMQTVSSICIGKHVKQMEIGISCGIKEALHWLMWRAHRNANVSLACLGNEMKTNYTYGSFFFFEWQFKYIGFRSAVYPLIVFHSNSFNWIFPFKWIGIRYLHSRASSYYNCNRIYLMVCVCVICF